MFSQVPVVRNFVPCLPESSPLLYTKTTYELQTYLSTRTTSNTTVNDLNGDASDLDTSGYIQALPISPSHNPNDSPRLSIKTEPGTSGYPTKGEKRVFDSFPIDLQPRKKKNPTTRQVESSDQWCRTVELLNTLIQQNNQMMEEQRTTFRYLMSKLDRLIDMNLHCQTRIGVTETRIRELQEKREATILSRLEQEAAELFIKNLFIQ